jgi:hypothetical protein
MQSLLWSGLVEYGQATWTQTRIRITRDPAAKQGALKKFDLEWGYWESLCSRQGMSVIWCRHSPLTGIG